MEHYKDDEDIIYWDVINESVMDDSTSDQINLRVGSSNSNEFFGWETYTEDIFTLAREHTNPNVKLFYNDYNAEANWGKFDDKTGAVYNYIKTMKKKGVPIDGVGLQMHVSCDNAPSYDQLTKLINMYEEIGVETHITEIDVTTARCSSLEGQKKVFLDVFRACFDNPNCTVFTVWGAYDTESWIGAENTPLIFDVDMYPKDIYFEMLDYVLDQLPSDATFPIPTVTTKPTSTPTTESLAAATYIIKPNTFMIESGWSNWSWGVDSVTFDDDGTAVVDYTEESYGAFSLHSSNVFNSGVLHFELKSSDADAKYQVIVHTVNGEKFVNLDIISDASTEEMKAYDITVPEVEGGYNRVSIQNSRALDVTITLDNFYFISSKDKDISTAIANYLIEPESFMFGSEWSNWSWGVDNVSFDDYGNAIIDFTEKEYGAFSLHSSNTFNGGTFHFEMKTDSEDAQYVVIAHTKTDGQFITIETINNASTEEMQKFDIKVPFVEGGFNRVSIQNSKAIDVTILLNNFYYITEPDNENTTSIPISNAIYLIKPESYMIDPLWSDWSWGTDNVGIDDNGNAIIDFTEKEYGAFSLHFYDVFNGGTFHFEMKSSSEEAQFIVNVHTKENNEFIKLETINNVSTEGMQAFDIRVPTIDSGYNRISIQNGKALDVAILVNNFYYLPDTEESSTLVSNAIYLIKPNSFSIDPSWNNWSWGTDSVDFDDDGNASADFTESEYGAFSLHTSGTFYSGTFYFDIKSSIENAKFLFIVHTKQDSEFVSIQTLEDVSTDMKTYQIKIPSIEGGYNRVSIQNMNAIDVTIYINNYYFIDSSYEESVTDEPTIEPIGEDEPIITEPVDEPIITEPVNEPVTTEPANDPLNEPPVEPIEPIETKKTKTKKTQTNKTKTNKTKTNKTKTHKTKTNKTKTIKTKINKTKTHKTKTNKINAFIKSTITTKTKKIVTLTPIKTTKTKHIPTIKQTKTLKTKVTKTSKNKSKETNTKQKCWAKAYDYKCCKSTTKEIIKDEYGSWGRENNEWCGIIEKN